MSEPLAAMLAELSARFRERAPAARAAMTSALDGNDRAAVVDIAHKLAGSAGMFGHPEIGLAAAELEEAARSGADMDGAARRLLALLAQLNS